MKKQKRILVLAIFIAFVSLAALLPRTVNAETYEVIQLVGTSDKSWEEAAKTAIETAGKSLRDLRIAEITKLDVTIENGKVSSYRAWVNISFKYQDQGQDEDY